MKLSDIQKSVLSFLQEREEWTSIVEIADSLFVHPNSARSATTKLTNYGLIERNQQRDGYKGRPTFVFRARTTRFNVLHDAFRLIEHASENEKNIIESLISGIYENILRDEHDIVKGLVRFFRDQNINTKSHHNTLEIELAHFHDIETEIPGFTSRVYRLIAQQAVGTRAAITLGPNYLNGECSLTVKPL